MDERSLARTSNTERDLRLKQMGGKIREYRRKKHWTQDTLAYQIGSCEGKAYVSRIELGKANISVAILCKIADALEVPVHELTADF